MYTSMVFNRWAYTGTAGEILLFPSAGFVNPLLSISSAPFSVEMILLVAMFEMKPQLIVIS
jgi:hypothetical protein